MLGRKTQIDRPDVQVLPSVQSRTKTMRMKDLIIFIDTAARGAPGQSLRGDIGR